MKLKTSRPDIEYKKLLTIGIPLLILTIFPHLPMPAYILHVAILICIQACLCYTWSIIAKYNILSFGQSGPFGLGAYTSTLLWMYLSVSPWIGMFVGGLVAIGLYALVGYLCFRLGVRGPYFALSGLVVAEALRLFFMYARVITGGSLGITIKYVGFSPVDFQFGKIFFYYISLVLLIIIILIVKKIDESDFGYVLRAIRDDELASETIGINVTMTKLKLFMISCFLAAPVGTIFCQYFLYLNPEMMFGVHTTIEMALMSLFGGYTSLMGPALGTLILVPIVEILRVTLGVIFIGFAWMIYGALMTSIIVLLPEGIISLPKAVHLKSMYLTKLISKSKQ